MRRKSNHRSQYLSETKFPTWEAVSNQSFLFGLWPIDEQKILQYRKHSNESLLSWNAKHWKVHKDPWHQAQIEIQWKRSDIGIGLSITTRRESWSGEDGWKINLLGSIYIRKWGIQCAASGSSDWIKIKIPLLFPWISSIPFSPYTTPVERKKAAKHIQTLNLRVGKGEVEFGARMNKAAQKCGNSYGEENEMTYFVGGLRLTIQWIVSSWREPRTRIEAAARSCWR